MRIEWYGHSFFQLTTDQGISMVIDPFDATVGYPLPKVSASVALISHQHYDHNNVSLVRGDPLVIDQPGEYVQGPFSIKGFASFHDDSKGTKRGNNTIFRIETEGMSVVHCGDLGTLPPLREIESWKPVDLLLVPVGGTFTVTLEEAVSLVETLQPGVTIPMHFKTSYLTFDLSGPDHFVSRFQRVSRLNTNHVQVDRENLPENPEIWVLTIEDTL